MKTSSALLFLCLFYFSCPVVTLSEPASTWRSSCNKAHQACNQKSNDASQLLCKAAEEAANAGKVIADDPTVQQLQNDMCDFAFTVPTKKDDELITRQQVERAKCKLASALYGNNSVEYWHALMDCAPFDRGLMNDAFRLQLELQVKQGKGDAVKAILMEHTRKQKIMQAQIQKSFEEIKSKLDELNKK